MGEEKLLYFLKVKFQIILTILLVYSSPALSEDYKNFANDIATQDTKLTIQNMQKIFSEYFNGTF